MTPRLKPLFAPIISFIICMAILGPLTYDNHACWVTVLFGTVGLTHGMWARRRWDSA